MFDLLGGLRVVDFSTTLAGVQSSQLFADFGADVTHVEPPGGSWLQAQPAYPFWMRSQKAVPLDLKVADGIAAARALVRDADVVIETWRPGVAERLGLGYEELAAENPALVYGSVTGFGRDNPLSYLKGYEGVVMAKFGAYKALAGMAPRPGPAFASVPYCSYPAAQLLSQGLLAALFVRERTGRGQRVDTSLARGLTVHDTFGWHARIVANRYSGGYTQSPLEQDGVPTGGLSFRLLIALTKDGRWLQFSQTAQRLFVAMMRAFELDWMFADPKFSTAPEFDEIATRIEFWEAMLATVRSKTAAEWLEVFDADPDVWGEMFRDGINVFDHPQVKWNQSVTTVDDPRHGPIVAPGPVVQVVRRSPGMARATPPLETGAPPFAGLTCLELGTYYAAPFGATLLADMGARVIKIEQLDGDPMRNMLPFPEIAGIKALQGKESIAVDIHTDEGREITRQLVARADIVLQSFRAGVAERLGLDADSLQKVNPNLVHLSSPGYGVGGPCGHRPAYAPTIGAGAGIAFRNAASIIRESADLDLGEVKRGAMQLARAVMGGGHADGLSSVTVGTALCLGLLARERGAGVHQLVTTMMTSVMHALSETMISYANQPPAPQADTQLLGFGSLYRLYECADDWVFLAAPSDRDWQALSALVPSIAELRGDDAALAAALAEAFATRPAAEWERVLTEVDVACVVCASAPIEANFMDAGSPGALTGLVTSCEHPLLETHERLVPLVSFSESGGVAAGGVLCGEQTASIMSELGYTDDDIARLVAASVISLGS